MSGWVMVMRLCWLPLRQGYRIMLELLTVIINSSLIQVGIKQEFLPVGDLGGLIGINDTWLRFRDARNIDSQDELGSMQYSGMYLLREDSELEYVRNCILVVIGNPNICCVQKLYNYNGSIYKYRVKWYSNYWDNW